MKIAILSDIHGNCVALDGVLDDLEHEKVGKAVCLGDAIQGGPQPVQVVERLRKLGCPVVMGNADAFMLSGDETGDEPTSEDRRKQLNAVREWSLAQLSASDRAFIQSFRPTVEIELEAKGRLLCFHGSPGSFDDVLLPDIPQETLFKFLGGYDATAMCGGHTHVQQIRRISSDARFFFNPGSVGFAYSHYQPHKDFQADPWAEYAILTSEAGKLSLEFRRVPFEVEALIEIYRKSGRPYAEAAIGQYKGR